jgi:hypothetical protein
METLSLDRLGDEIAELSAHLDAASARLLDLIREFNAREGSRGSCSTTSLWTRRSSTVVNPRLLANATTGRFEEPWASLNPHARRR